MPCLCSSIDVGPNAITDKERGVKVRGERTGLSQPASSQIPNRAASRRFQISCAYRENRGGEGKVNLNGAEFSRYRHPSVLFVSLDMPIAYCA